MAALTNARDTSEIANGAKALVLPVKGSTTIYQGSLVAIDANGYAIPAKKAASLTAAGRAEETVKNEGSDGDVVINVSRILRPPRTSSQRPTSSSLAIWRTTRPLPLSLPAPLLPGLLSEWMTTVSR